MNIKALLWIVFTPLTVLPIIRKEQRIISETEFTLVNVRNDMGEPIAIEYSLRGQDLKSVLRAGNNFLSIPIALSPSNRNNRLISDPIDFYENSSKDVPDQVVRLFVSKTITNPNLAQQTGKIHILMALVDLTQENEPIIQVIDEIKKDYVSTDPKNNFYIDVHLDGEEYTESGLTLRKQT